MSILRQYRGLFVLRVALTFTLPAFAGNLPVTGVPNFHQVNEHIFRGAQPSAEGFQSLAKTGVKVVIDLRPAAEHSTAEEARAVEAAGMRYVNVPIKSRTTPSNEQMGNIMALFNSGEPVFVHCHAGKDRTGAVIACYRIAHDGWKSDHALNEARSFGMGSTQFGLKDYVKAFIPATVLATSK